MRAPWLAKINYSKYRNTKKKGSEHEIGSVNKDPLQRQSLKLTANTAAASTLGAVLLLGVAIQQSFSSHFLFY
jgi:hypothetical protein